MEPRKDIPDEVLREDRPSIEAGPDEYFRKAVAFARRHYAEEMREISRTVFQCVTSEKFFLEYVWVVHATGFNARVVGKMMPRLVEAYGRWSSLGSEPPDAAVERVRPVCNNPAKIRAIHSTARILVERVLSGKTSWEQFRSASLSSPEKLRELPYVGRVTCYHLARNIGLLECVKPDLHLVRLASRWGFRDCVAMCESMRDGHRERTGEVLPLGIVDLVVWYSCSTFGTLEARPEGGR